jgi:tRNA A-37 threonylcarbamoyl transferase component Bud32
MTEKGAEIEKSLMDIHDDDPTHQPITSRKDVILQNQQVTIQDFCAAFHSNEDTDMAVCKWTKLLCYWPVTENSYI